MSNSTVVYRKVLGQKTNPVGNAVSITRVGELEQMIVTRDDIPWETDQQDMLEDVVSTSATLAGIALDTISKRLISGDLSTVSQLTVYPLIPEHLNLRPKSARRVRVRIKSDLPARMSFIDEPTEFE